MAQARVPHLALPALGLVTGGAVLCTEGRLQHPWPPPTDASRILMVVAARDVSRFGHMSPE